MTMDELKELLPDMPKYYSHDIKTACRNPKTADYVTSCLNRFMCGDYGDYKEAHITKWENRNEEYITGIYENRFNLEQPLQIYAYLCTEPPEIIKEREAYSQNHLNMIYLEYCDYLALTGLDNLT